MEDHQIIQMYWDRQPEAVAATARKYGAYCYAVAWNILNNREDAEECVNDVYLRTWNAIPPHRPSSLSAFLGKLARNLSFNRYKHIHAGKRGSGEFALVLDELNECVSGKDSVEQEMDRQELVSAINAFLHSLPIEKRTLFLRRYWYADSVADIAALYKTTPNNVSVMLNRLRKKLKACLSERGFLL